MKSLKEENFSPSIKGAPSQSNFSIAVHKEIPSLAELSSKHLIFNAYRDGLRGRHTIEEILNPKPIDLDIINQ
jgi:hypothetical protein